MLYFLLAVIFTVALYLIMRAYPRYKVHSSHAIVFNYYACGATGLILMMDIRHPMTDFDLLMLDWAVASGMPMHILLTKADKLTYGAAKNTLLKVQSEIRKGWGDAITIQLFSAPKRMGVEEAQLVLAQWLGLIENGEEAGEEA